MDYGISESILTEETKETIVWAVNETPEGFRVPTNKVINKVIEVCQKQLDIDKKDNKDKMC